MQETGVRFDRKRMEKERGIRCLATGTGWLYEWSSNGMLKKVIRPDGRPVEFRYDALGRRTAKQYFGKVTRWVWDGNVPIHEWGYKVTNMQPDEEESAPPKEPTEDITTWVFEAGTFVPTAKIQDGKQYSIVSDYLGTPIQMYDELGNKTWDCTLDIYGKVTNFEGSSLNECPFRMQGQYFDSETNLCYNRFRYYSPETGTYLSQDPIGLQGGSRLYGYVHNPNGWIDQFGLSELVYQLLNDKGEVVYYGITSRTAEERLAEHLANPEKIGKVANMEVLAEGLSHDQARSIEGALIRKRMAENVDKFSATDSIDKQLEKSGLLNKNRGRVKERWTSDNPLDEFKDKISKNPKKVKCH